MKKFQVRLYKGDDEGEGFIIEVSNVTEKEILLLIVNFLEILRE